MPAPNKADPAIYAVLRAGALKPRPGKLDDGSVQVVLMDWHVDNGTVSVLAAADGTASVYLSSGGGFIGGAQKYPSIRAAALAAVQIAGGLTSHFASAPDRSLPPGDRIFFYLTTAAGVFRAAATQSALKDGSDPLVRLGGAMQRILTEYRLKFGPKPA